jgi:hypothetical protein
MKDRDTHPRSSAPAMFGQPHVETTG